MDTVWVVLVSGPSVWLLLVFLVVVAPTATIAVKELAALSVSLSSTSLNPLTDRS